MEPKYNRVEEYIKDDSTHDEPFAVTEQDLTLQEMRAMLESSPAGIGIVKNRVLGWTNDILCSMLGYESNSLKGKDTRIFYADQKEYDRVGVDLYSKLDKCNIGLVETKLVKKDGSMFDCRIRASRLNKQDLSKGIIFVITDISELKLLQIQLHQAQKMEAIGVLAGGISHDFNNILMGVQGHLSLMQIDVSNTEKVTAHAKHIRRLVKTAAELTGRLLGFARGGKYQISVLNVNELLAMSLTIFNPTRKDIIVHETYEEKPHPVDADQSQLEQIFLNLLINASQALPEHGDIFVTTRNIVIKEDHDYLFEIHPGKYIKVTIKDTGIGMDLETQDKIFDPFFSTKGIGDKKGRGLGLSTVYGIVKNHGGFILVDSEKGKGASFHICLPASKNIQVKEIKEESPSFEQMQKGSETVLLVDDEEDIINVGKNFLEKLGYKPMIARNGLEAVEIFRLYKDDISLIVLDLIMPKMNGKQAFAEIKNIQEDAKILISTGYAVDEKIEGFLNKGCHGFIQKPFSMNTFARTLRQILD
ncbi:MAG: hybrid sensor histidine kinase/response regulator [Deltaproteobacteria bacterium]|nr:MAG: hybrid sensor histidine kinase/response regulator [Deltaproteobacteria bacterium]